MNKKRESDVEIYFSKFRFKKKNEWNTFGY